MILWPANLQVGVWQRLTEPESRASIPKDTLCCGAAAETMQESKKKRENTEM